MKKKDYGSHESNLSKEIRAATNKFFEKRCQDESKRAGIFFGRSGRRKGEETITNQ